MRSGLYGYPNIAKNKVGSTASAPVQSQFKPSVAQNEMNRALGHLCAHIG